MKRVYLLTAILVSSLAVTVSCGKKSTDEATPAASNVGQSPGGPAPGAAISFTSLATTSMTVNWGAATDAATPQASLMYKLVSATNNNIGDATSAEVNGTLVMDWTAATTSHAVTGLSVATTYYFTVLIKNNAGIVSYQTSTQGTLCSGKMIYLAPVNWGNLGGKAGADSICNSHKPAGFSGTAKALIGISGGSRQACSGADCTSSNAGQTDWPLAANTTYCSTGYAKQMGTTNGVGYLNVTLSNSLSSVNTYTYTGLTTAMANYTNNNCNDFTALDSGHFSEYGRANFTGANFHDYGQCFCTTGGSIYCVEQ